MRRPIKTLGSNHSQSFTLGKNQKLIEMEELKSQRNGLQWKSTTPRVAVQTRYKPGKKKTHQPIKTNSGDHGDSLRDQ